MISIYKEIKKRGRKPASAKAEGENTQNNAITAEMIEKKAFELYENRGCLHGYDLEDWLEAKRILGAEMTGARRK